MPIYLTEAEVERLTGAVPDFDALSERLEAGFRDYAAGRIAAPREERQRLVFPPGTERRPYPKDMRIVPALVPGAGASGVHVGCDALGHPKRSFMLLFDFDTMQPLAVIEDTHLHYIRAGAPTAIAVRRLARPGASVLAVIGSGHIARVQVAAAVSQAPVREVRVYSPTEAHREAFSRFCRDELGVAAAAVGSARDAVEGADIVTVATDSFRSPAMDGSWLAPGALVASVTPGELDPGTVRACDVIVTSRNRVVSDYTAWEPLASLVRSGERVLAEIPTLGDVLLGRSPGRTSPERRICFLSPGIGFMDVAIARWVYDTAAARGIGTRVG